MNFFSGYGNSENWVLNTGEILLLSSMLGECIRDTCVYHLLISCSREQGSAGHSTIVKMPKNRSHDTHDEIFANKDINHAGATLQLFIISFTGIRCTKRLSNVSIKKCHHCHNTLNACIKGRSHRLRSIVAASCLRSTASFIVLDVNIFRNASAGATWSLLRTLVTKLRLKWN